MGNPLHSKKKFFFKEICYKEISPGFIINFFYETPDSFKVTE